MTATEVSPQSEPAQPEVFPQMTAEALERYLEQHPEVPREILAGAYTIALDVPVLKRQEKADPPAADAPEERHCLCPNCGTSHPIHQ